MKDCVFCKKIKEGSVTLLGKYAAIFEPLNPVTKGHMLVISTNHVADFTEDPETSAKVMWAASMFAEGKNLNLITSKGKYATQTIKHLHLHIVPRRKNDNLKLPWSF